MQPKARWQQWEHTLDPCRWLIRECSCEKVYRPKKKVLISSSYRSKWQWMGSCATSGNMNLLTLIGTQWYEKWSTCQAPLQLSSWLTLPNHERQKSDTEANTEKVCCKCAPHFTHCSYNCRGTSHLRHTISDWLQIVKENRNWTQNTTGIDHIANAVTAMVQHSWKHPFQWLERTTIFGFHHRKYCLQ